MRRNCIAVELWKVLFNCRKEKRGFGKLERRSDGSDRGTCMYGSLVFVRLGGV